MNCTYSVSFIGAGNIAFRLSLAFVEAGVDVSMVYNRTRAKGEKLVRALHSNGSSVQYTDDIADTFGSDFVFIAVSDDALSEVASSLWKAYLKRISSNNSHSPHYPMILHVSGATDISELQIMKDAGCEYGVFYPLMTMTASKNINLGEIPFMIEASSDQAEQSLVDFAKSIKCNYTICDSTKRLRMHTAAVFSCNFVNYILGLAFDIAGHGHVTLLPATMEMVRKAFLQLPRQVQTGPAVRGDMHTIQKHLQLLDEIGFEEHKEIYKLISDNIIKEHKNK